ncbi:MAG: protein kinase [Christensenellaceae bacterium]|jgi:cellulose synthase/poly-beta-1,6-N-acetylglucosamine synthase-like glycosyltransferase/predicted Ser/Thr protein kinase|nr:protein kinase [Christensenellaceae bacterium]
MRRKQTPRKKGIPESLGNGVCGVWLYIVALVFDAMIHIGMLISYQPTSYGFIRLFLSFIFFIYPLHYIVDILWSMRPSVCEILSGRFLINRKHYMNTAQREIGRDAFLPVTISVPVYTENNEVIFDTLRMSLAATKRYREFSAQATGVIVSDDGLAPMLGGICTKEKADAIVHAFINTPPLLTQQERQAAERIRFYREHGIAFVVRPSSGRAGLFKKSSNLNYTLCLGNAVAGGKPLDTLTQEGSSFAGGYAEGNITTNEIILLLDKDSGVKERIIEAIIPEFAADEKLAYVQCATIAANMYDNYYTYATGHQANNLFHNIWPCKALQGFFVPLVGHNVFLRKSMLEKSGLWAENRVSEDYDKAICLYNMGYHGKYAQIKGLEFTEYVSRTFTEETGKQHRYAYGLFEMMFDGTISPRKTRKCDTLYMAMYFFSVINQVMLLPTVLVECYFGNIYLLWAGFIVCNIGFILLPYIRGLIMRKRLPKEQSETLIHIVIVALSFVGHSFSMLSGACRYFANKIKANKNPFPSTSVDKLKYHFGDGIKLLVEYIRKNKWLIPIAILCLDRGIFMITKKGIEPVTSYIYSYILFSAVLVPILLTPQLFAGFGMKQSMAQLKLGGGYIKHNTKDMSSELGASAWSTNTPVLSPRVVDSSQDKRIGIDSDIDSFLSAYEKKLQETIPDEHMPEALTSSYSFESCIRKDAEGKKEIYLLRNRQSGAKALLRATKDCPEEDALEEARLLTKLDHPGVPKVYASYEQDGKAYIVREYVEGRTLYEIVKSSGCLRAEDIFHVVLKLTDILSYLHAQVPPVIHRDIKPQNIIVGKDGGIHLIDFGIARVYKEERTQDTSVILTWDYASPEQYGFEQTTPLSDIYSLGIAMLFMATEHTNRSGLESQIVNNRLRNLIEHCIAFNPEERFLSVNELRNFIRRNHQQSLKGKGKRRLAIATSLIAAVACLSACFYGTGILIGKSQGNEAGYEKGYDAGYIDGYEDVPVFKTEEMRSNPESGNIPGNMAIDGGAFAAQGNDFVFFISGGDIYRMSERVTEPELLAQGENAGALSYHNGWLYYSSGSRILQKNIYTLESNVLCENISGKLYITNGNYYVQGDDGLYLLNTATGDISALNNLSACAYTNIEDEKIFFINENDQALYSAELNGDGLKKIIDGVCRSVCLFEGDMFCAIYDGESGELVRIDGGTGAAETLAEVNAVTLNASGRGIYFIDTFDRTINLWSLDGSIRIKISKNRATDFNIAAGWIYYHNEADGGRLWRVRWDGTNDHPIQTGR